jgi:hypothetical protein
LEDGPQVGESDDLVFDEVILGFNRVLQFRVESVMKQFEMILRLSISLLFEC